MPEELFEDAFLATDPDKLKDLRPDELERYHTFFVRMGPEWDHHREISAKCRSRIALLGKEIELRRVLEQNASQHQESLKLANENVGIGEETRKWTKVGAIAAIAAALFAGAALLQDTPLSKLLHAIASRSSTTSSRQMTATVSPSPTPREEKQP